MKKYLFHAIFGLRVTDTSADKSAMTFQKANGISPTVFVGVLTRTKITERSCG